MSERMCTSAGRGQGFDSVPLGHLPLQHALSGSLGRPQQRRTDKGRKPDVGKIVVCTMLSIDGYTEGPLSGMLAIFGPLATSFLATFVPQLANGQ
jgi:hypothetical protein